jgi:hypothetical protein
VRFLFVVVGLLGLAAMAGPAWWLLRGAGHLVIIGLVIWAAMMLLREPRRPRHAPASWGPPPPRHSPPPRRPAPERRPPQASERLPLDVEVKVEQIRRKTEVLLSQREHFPLGSDDLYAVRATQDDYLPRTLAAFLAVPQAFRERPMPNGKTPLDELKEQLRLLDTKLDEVAEDLQRRNQDRLLANRQFLEERFGRPAVRL